MPTEFAKNVQRQSVKLNKYIQKGAITIIRAFFYLILMSALLPTEYIKFLIKKEATCVASFLQTLNFLINYLAAFAVSKTTENASGSLTAKSANIFLFTVMLAFLQALTNLE